jgi:hypothetical protein
MPMNITRSLKGLFWAGNEPADAEQGSDDAADGDAGEVAGDAAATSRDATRGGVTAPASPVHSGRESPPPVDVLPDIDFAAIYTRTNTAGDPKVDQVLTAFEAMKSAMPAPQLAVAINATAKAIGADPAAIIATITARLGALDTTLTEEQAKTSEREATRNRELETLSQKVHAEIEAMEHKCAAFRQQLAAASERIQQRTAAEHEVIAGFGTKARGEADRLKALRDFLSPHGAPTKS